MTIAVLPLFYVILFLIALRTYAQQLQPVSQSMRERVSFRWEREAQAGRLVAVGSLEGNGQR